MPVIDHKLTKTANSKKFAGVDITYSYWQLLLASPSRVCQTILTPDGIFTPIRVLHKTTSSMPHLQACPSTELTANLLERVFP